MVTYLWAYFVQARLGTIFWLSFSLLPFFFFLLFICPAFAALSFWFAVVPVTFRLVVRLWVVGCPPAVSPLKVGGLGWLAVRACGRGYSVDLLFRWLSALGGLLMQSNYFTADCLCLSACCTSASVFSVS